MNNTRVKWIDYAKGIAILLLLLSHCLSSGGLVFTIITAFDMPIFFVVCGSLNAICHNNRCMDVPLWAKKRFKQLMIPYLIFGLLWIFFLEGIAGFGFSNGVFVRNIIKLFTFQGVASLWFIPVFLLSEALYLFVVSRRKPHIQVIFLIFIVLLTFLTSIHGYPSFFGLRLLLKVLIGISFMIIGFFMIKFPAPHYGLLIIGLFIAVSFSLYNGNVSIGALNLNNVIVFYLCATLFSYLTIWACKYIDNHIVDYWGGVMRACDMVALFGANSIVVLVTNNFLIETSRLIEYKLLNNMFVNNGLLGGLLLSGVLAVPEYLIIRLSQGRLAVVFGKRRLTTK